MTVARSEVDGVEAIAPVYSPSWDALKVGDRTYQVRRTIASTEEYAVIKGLTPVAGTFFSASDVARPGGPLHFRTARRGQR